MFAVDPTDPVTTQQSTDHFTILVYAIVSGFIAICTLIGIALPLLLRQNRKIDETKEQITNGHSTHIRDDLDNLKDIVMSNQANNDRRFNTQSDFLIGLGERIGMQEDTLSRHTIDKMKQEIRESKETNHNE